MQQVPNINVKLIDKFLKRDAEAHLLTAGELVRKACPLYDDCKTVGRCAIGSLLFYGGLGESLHNDVKEANLNSKAGKLLKEKFGLLPIHTLAIEQVNDNSGYGSDDKMDERYDEVMGLIGFIQMAQENGIRFNSLDEILTAYRWEDDGYLTGPFGEDLWDDEEDEFGSEI